MFTDLTLPLDLDPQNNPFLAEKGQQAKLGHLGTHMDVMNTPGPEPSRFICRGLKIDVRGIYNRPITPADLGEAQPGPADLVAFHTGWLAQFYGTEYYFKGHPELGQPELSDELVEMLIGIGVGYIAIDGPGAKRPDQHHEVDLHCARHGVYIIEHVANLEKLKAKDFLAYCFPLNLVGSTGLPVRLLARV